jgi:hypothetical protein
MNNQPILERYEEFWEQAAHTHDCIQMAQIIRGILAFFGDDPKYCDSIEVKVSVLEAWYPIMSLEEFTKCAKACTYAKRRLSSVRGTRYGAGLSRAITESERDELRSQGNESDRSGTQSNGTGIESGGSFVSDLYSDDSDDS